MERRDFTINAIARRLETGELLDPLGGREDLARRILRTTSRRASATTRCGSSAACASSRSSASSPTRTRCARCASGRRGSRTSRRADRRRSRADGMGELSKLLLGAHPAKALRLARDTGVLPQRAAGARRLIGYEQDSSRQNLAARRARLRGRPGGRGRGRALAVRLGALLHDLGKPEAGATDARPRAAERPRSRGSRAAPPPLSEPAGAARHAARARARVPELPDRRPSTRGGSSRPTATSSRSTCSSTRRPTFAGSTSRRGARGARDVPRRSSSRSARAARTGSPTSPSTATT